VSAGTSVLSTGPSAPAHRATYCATSAKHDSRTFSAESVAPRATAGMTLGASATSVASEGGGLEASPAKSLFVRVDWRAIRAEMTWRR